MSVHIGAPEGSIAKYVLLPGDPKRATFIADTFLDEAKLVTDVRGMVGYTGYYKNSEVSIIASGMGSPSAGIYSYELYSFYNVETIIRIGTCGGFKKQIRVGDLIFALTASTDSAWAHQYNLKGSYSPFCDFSLLEKCVYQCRILNIPFHVGMILSSDLFSSYNALGETSWHPWAKMGALAQDMETYALYGTAAYLNKRALSILTMTDSCVTGNSVEDDKRLKAAEQMAIVALETIKDL
ncbi:MAG: purine-nucleoside phosphorylase [Sphaerochaetaceae bacterium]|jgi:purine-nucleoside phosphorylase